MTGATVENADETRRLRYWRQIAEAHEPGAYQALDEAYRQPHRAYHSWAHIDELLTGLERFDSLATRPDLIAAAIFWHDAVHLARDPDGKTRLDRQNVRDSVSAFRRHTVLTGGEAQAVEDLVMATSDHARARATTEHYAGFSGDLDLFVDLDLSPLAAPWEIFAANTQKIRSESIGVEEAEFAANQAKMLEGLAQGDRPVFRRAETRAAWDATARVNLARCIAGLRAAGR
ncbi:hypothetical protein A1351_18225 [Methylosinus sp. R-45379]|jgi:predicted metal-dependent HD superfamily phosphohydrolase|uniref:HD domain-containing protein n=1 Tax=unclassified Methylosinus TaxID=2624500 RepID=UPI000465BD7D|nr:MULTISPECIES: hypothetical protein [unclassified Methylosinus]OAI24328.1 hypothetical protein A1351_18225 [Methylosinus sp. R-45379]TDX60561.1 putative metal-dependent HD superfamily phosphohydrolase [Methylosinus sp. sav-2]